MTDTRATFGAILGTIATTATLATKTLNTINDGVDMGANAVASMKRQQIFRNKLDDLDYEHRILVESAKTRAEHKLAVQAFRKKSTEHKQAFDASLAELTEALAASENQS